MFVSPQNSYTEIPTPSVLALESAPFGRWLDHEGRAPMNGIGTLIKEGLTLFLSSPFSISCALQSCLTLCNPMDYSPPGSSVHGILQARILEWVATSYSRGSSRPTAQTCIFCIGRQILYHWATREVCISVTRWLLRPCSLSSDKGIIDVN